MDDHRQPVRESDTVEEQITSEHVVLPPAPETSTRRHVLVWFIRIGFAAFAFAFALPALALKTLKREVKTVASGDKLVYASGQKQGEPLNANDFDVGTVLQAFPASKTNDSQNLIELVHLSDERANDSPPIVAYSAICTHLGCSVLPKLTADGNIPCPCHGSVFNPAEDAAVVSGPAGRPLPSLPIEVQDDGSIVVTGPFSGKIGPD